MAKTEAKARYVLNLLLPLVLVAAVLLPAQTTQAQTDPGISTTQTVDADPATVGWPLTFAVTVTNGSAAQRVGLKDFLPPGMTLVSATPSQGTCGAGGHDGGDVAECTLGLVPGGGSATVEIVATPTIPGTATNTAVALGEFAPATPANSNAAIVPVNPGP